jgi:hypothetical protein
MNYWVIDPRTGDVVDQRIRPSNYDGVLRPDGEAALLICAERPPPFVRGKVAAARGLSAEERPVPSDD